MAFIASKYTGGIGINNVDILTPLFAGGGASYSPIKYEPFTEGNQTQLNELNSIGYNIEANLTMLQQKAASGDITPEEYKTLVLLGEQKATQSSTYSQVKDNAVKLHEALGGIFSSDIAITSKGLPGSFVSMNNLLLRNDPEALLYSRMSNWGNFTASQAHKMSLYDENGDVNVYHAPSILKKENKGYENAQEEYLNSVTGSFKINKGQDDAIIAAQKGKEFATAISTGYSSNVVNIYNSENTFLDKVRNDEGLYQDAQSRTMNAIFKGTYQSPYVKGITGKDESQGVYYILQGGTADKPSYYAEVYRAGVQTPTYTEASKENGQWMIGKEVTQIKNLNLQYIREDVFNNIDEEKFMQIYMGIDPNVNGVVDEEKFSILHNTLYNMDEKFKTQFGSLRTIDNTSKEEYLKYVADVFQYAENKGKNIFNRLTDNYIKQQYDQSTSRVRQTEISSDQKSIELKDTEDDGTVLGNDLVYALSTNGLQSSSYYHQRPYSNAIGGSIWKQTQYTFSISSNYRKRLWGDIVVNKISEDNKAYSSDDGKIIYSAVNIPGVGNINFNKNSTDLNARTILGNNSAQFVFTIKNDLTSHNVPISFKDIASTVRYVSDEVLLGMGMKDNIYMLDKNKQLIGDPKNIIEGDISQAGQFYKTAYVSISGKDFMEQEITLSNEDFISMMKTGGDAISIKYGDRTHQVNVSDVYNESGFEATLLDAMDWYSKNPLGAVKTGLRGFFDNFTDRKSTKNAYTVDWMMSHEKEILEMYNAGGGSTMPGNITKAQEDKMKNLFSTYSTETDENIKTTYSGRFEYSTDGKLYGKFKISEIYKKPKELVANWGYSDKNKNGVYFIDKDSENTENMKIADAKTTTKIEDMVVLLKVYTPMSADEISPINVKGKEAFYKTINNNQPTTTTTGTVTR